MVLLGSSWPSASDATIPSLGMTVTVFGGSHAQICRLPDSVRRDCERDDTEERCHLHEQHVLRHGAADEVLHRIDEDRQRPIHIFDRTPNWSYEARRIPANVHRELGLPRFARVRIVERKVHLAT